jgi:hypothetical protein
VEVGQCAIGGGDGVCEDDIDLTAELVEDLGESEGGAYGVAVGASVGGEKEAGVGTEGCQESGNLGLNRGFMREGFTRVGCGSLEVQQLGFGCHDLAVTG